MDLDKRIETTSIKKEGSKKKWYVIGGIIALIVILWIIYSLVGEGYKNGFIKKEETATAQWAQVENVYQRKYDLIPNLVATVKQFAEHEKEVLIKVTEARAKATSINIDASNLTPEKMAEFEKAQSQLSGALSRLLVTVEKYPDIKANQNFIKLQDELAGSENRISTERRKYNETVRVYNTSLRVFPNRIFASGFNKKPLFSADDNAKGGKVDVDKLFDK